MPSIEQATNVVRRQIPWQAFLLCALLLATGTLAQAAEPGMALLKENLRGVRFSTP